MNEEDYDVSSIDEDAQLPMDMVYPVNEETEVPNTHGGLFKTVLIAGTGSLPVKGSTATVHYVGTLLNGTQFDSSRDRGEPFVFTLGKGQVIKGWDVGVSTMHTGEKAVLRCSPDYAYGAAGSPPTIPPQSTLLFEVELLEWSCEEDISAHKDRSIMKHLLVQGTGYDKPDFESTLTIDLAVYLGECNFAESDGSAAAVWEKRDWKVHGSETPLPPQLLACLQAMQCGEEAGFRVAGRCVPAEGDESFGIPAASARVHDSNKMPSAARTSSSAASLAPMDELAISYRVRVKELEKVDPWDFTGEEKIRQGVLRKDKGNAALQRRDMALAERFYHRALEFIGEDHGMSAEDKKACVQARVAVMNNLAHVMLQGKRYKEAVTQLNKVLALEPNNSKALFRLAKAQDGTQSWQDALSALNRLLEHDADNADAKALRAHILAEQKAYDAKQKSNFKKLFA